MEWMIEYSYRAGLWAQHPQCQTHQSRLARTVEPYQRHNLADGNLKVQVSYSRPTAEHVADVLHHEHLSGLLVRRVLLQAQEPMQCYPIAPRPGSRRPVPR